MRLLSAAVDERRLNLSGVLENTAFYPIKYYLHKSINKLKY